MHKDTAMLERKLSDSQDMYFRDFIGTSYFTIGIQLTQPCQTLNSNT